MRHKNFSCNPERAGKFPIQGSVVARIEILQPISRRFQLLAVGRGHFGGGGKAGATRWRFTILVKVTRTVSK